MQDIRSTIPSSNYGGARGVPIDTIVFHHIVGDAQAAISRFRQEGVEVSSTYIIGSNGEAYYTVDESKVPYTNGNYEWNRRSITIEHAGGGGVPYTEPMYQASINLVRDIRKRHQITQFKRHRDIKATACPGDLDVERIIKYSKEEPMFNEGDRKNINLYLFGEDRGHFKGAVGKDWKNAMYYGVLETPDFKIAQTVNKGDAPAINSAFSRTDGATQAGKTWKDFFYQYTIKNIPSSEYVPVTDQLFKRKA